MKFRLHLHHRRRLCRALVLVLVLATFQPGSTRASPEALINTINVNTTADEYDASPNASCSLREAIRSANDNADFGGCNSTSIYGNDVINIPAGTYTLTRAGIDEDSNSTADLDILASVTLDGAGGAGDVVIKGGASYSGRIIHVLAGTVILKDMTLRDGNLPNGRAGAGLRTEPGTTTTLNNVVVGLNTADGNAGGILNRGTMTLNGSSVTNNQTLNATQGGGGLFNDDSSTLTLNDSRVLSNTAIVAQENLANTQGGGGIFNDVGAMLTLDNTTVDGNAAAKPDGSTTITGSGGGIFSKGSMSIFQSTVSNNSNHTIDGDGGGLQSNSVALIDHSLITGNVAERRGGGIATFGGSLTVTDSIISNNASGGGGGLSLDNSDMTIINTTISGNQAGFGGGGISAGSNVTTALALENSTISGNQANADGGGISVGFDPSLSVSLINVTVANNTSNADGLGGEGGGGTSFGGNHTTMRNSVLAGNIENGLGDHDDCEGSISSGGNNLIQNSSGCALTGGGGSDLLDISAKLGSFAANGGPVVGASTSPIVAGMGTYLPASDSPLIDHGNASGCKNRGNANNLTTDQRGFLRPVDGPDPDAVATCDIGAVEFGSLIDLIFADSFD